MILKKKDISSLRQQDLEYKKLYEEWQNDRRNKYGYRTEYAENANTYQEGKGFSGEYPAADERASLRSSVDVLMLTLICYALLEFIVKLLLSDFPFNAPFGVVLGKEGFTSSHDLKTIIFAYVGNIFTRVIPFGVLLLQLKLPLKVVIPTKINDRPLFYCSIPVAMLTFGVIYMCTEVEALFLPGLDNRSIMRWSGAFTVYDIPISLLFMVIVPILSEFLHRGIILNLFRQYGDGFALLISSVISAALSAEDAIVMTFVYSLMIGYFTLRTGSILTAIVMRIIISGSYYIISIGRSGAFANNVLSLLSAMVIFLYIGIGIIILIRFVINYSNKISLPLYSLYLSDAEKLMICFSQPGFIIWISLYIASLAWSIAFGNT